MTFYEKSLALHADNKGKFGTLSKVEVHTREDLSTVYSPGVAEPSRAIAANADLVYEYTPKGNMIAVVSDGSAVLGLGNIGAKAAIPVMEGKSILFKNLADIDAVPICLDTQDTDEIVKAVKYLAPTFGAINLEDISAPRCFEIEKRLKEALDIPVFHDDQHGTAICVLAGLINAHRVLKKVLKTSRVVINGAGAAGNAIVQLMLAYGVKDIVVCDIKGILNLQNPQSMLNESHRELASKTNKTYLDGSLADALMGADVFIGVSRGGLVSKDMVASMNPNAIVFAMANPDPEILPDEALAGGAAIVGTGRSDFPNMINNVMIFPGILKGALMARASDINHDMYIASAMALANLLPEEALSRTNLFPDPLDREISKAVAEATAEAARKSGVARI